MTAACLYELPAATFVSTRPAASLIYSVAALEIVMLSEPSIASDALTDVLADADSEALVDADVEPLCDEATDADSEALTDELVLVEVLTEVLVLVDSLEATDADSDALIEAAVSDSAFAVLANSLAAVDACSLATLSDVLVLFERLSAVFVLLAIYSDHALSSSLERATYSSTIDW